MADRRTYKTPARGADTTPITLPGAWPSESAEPTASLPTSPPAVYAERELCVPIHRRRHSARALENPIIARRRSLRPFVNVTLPASGPVITQEWRSDYWQDNIPEEVLINARGRSKRATFIPEATVHDPFFPSPPTGGYAAYEARMDAEETFHNTTSYLPSHLHADTRSKCPRPIPASHLTQEWQMKVQERHAASHKEDEDKKEAVPFATWLTNVHELPQSPLIESHSSSVCSFDIRSSRGLSNLSKDPTAFVQVSSTNTGTSNSLVNQDVTFPENEIRKIILEQRNNAQNQPLFTPFSITVHPPETESKAKAELQHITKGMQNMSISPNAVEQLGQDLAPEASYIPIDHAPQIQHIENIATEPQVQVKDVTIQEPRQDIVSKDKKRKQFNKSSWLTEMEDMQIRRGGGYGVKDRAQRLMSLKKFSEDYDKMAAKRKEERERNWKLKEVRDEILKSNQERQKQVEEKQKCKIAKERTEQRLQKFLNSGTKATAKQEQNAGPAEEEPNITFRKENSEVYRTSTGESFMLARHPKDEPVLSTAGHMLGPLGPSRPGSRICYNLGEASYSSVQTVAASTFPPTAPSPSQIPYINFRTILRSASPPPPPPPPPPPLPPRPTTNSASAAPAAVENSGNADLYSPPRPIQSTGRDEKPAHIGSPSESTHFDDVPLSSPRTSHEGKDGDFVEVPAGEGDEMEWEVIDGEAPGSAVGLPNDGRYGWMLEMMWRAVE